MVDNVLRPILVQMAQGESTFIIHVVELTKGKFIDYKITSLAQRSALYSYQSAKETVLNIELPKFK